MKTLTSILKEVRSVEFNGSTYYAVIDVERALKEDGQKAILLKKDAIVLPFPDKSARAMTGEQIKESLRLFVKQNNEQEDLSDFNKKLNQALNFDPKK